MTKINFVTSNIKLFIALVISLLNAFSDASNQIPNHYSETHSFSGSSGGVGDFGRPLRLHPHKQHLYHKNRLESERLSLFGPEFESLPSQQWFSQPLDHFAPITDYKMWNQRYWVQDAHIGSYRYNHKIETKMKVAFLMIGGEGRANPKWMNSGMWLEYAKNFGALCFMLEHRFYGDSHPTDDLSVGNLKYLSSKQALADVANFINFMNKVHFFGANDVKWIVFGGSYPGSLAAWARLKYPHLIHGAVSSSGPLRAKVNFYEYLEVVKNVMDVTDPSCFDSIHDGLKKMSLMLNHPVGWQVLSDKFRLCHPLNATNPNDVANLFESVVGDFEDIIQYNNDNRLSSIHKPNIKFLCDVMLGREEINGAKAKNSFDGLVAVNDIMLGVNVHNREACFDNEYSIQVANMRKEGWNDASGYEGSRQWIYQTCTEFGWYQSSDQPNHPFTDKFPIKFEENLCSDVYGPQFTPKSIRKSVERSNIEYGSLRLKVSNVVFVHGSFDPWHAMGLFETNRSSTEMPIIYIEGTAHCANMYPKDATLDPPNLVEAREQILQLLTKWIS